MPTNESVRHVATGRARLAEVRCGDAASGDEGGRQSNITGGQADEIAEPRYKALAEATDANWSRRDYFKQALLHPGEIQLTRPYRSLAGKTQCITLSVLVDTHAGKRVACLDLDCS